MLLPASSALSLICRTRLPGPQVSLGGAVSGSQSSWLMRAWEGVTSVKIRTKVLWDDAPLMSPRLSQGRPRFPAASYPHSGSSLLAPTCQTCIPRYECQHSPILVHVLLTRSSAQDLHVNSSNPHAIPGSFHTPDPLLPRRKGTLREVKPPLRAKCLDSSRAEI